MKSLVQDPNWSKFQDADPDTMYRTFRSKTSGTKIINERLVIQFIEVIHYHFGTVGQYFVNIFSSHKKILSGNFTAVGSIVRIQIRIHTNRNRKRWKVEN